MSVKKCLEANLDASYDAPSGGGASPNFRDGFRAALKDKYGEVCRPANIVHYPWVGADYRRQSKKTLIVLESPYLRRDKPDSAITNNADSLCSEDYGRRILAEAAILGPGNGGYSAPVYQRLTKLLTGCEYADADRVGLWRALALYNFLNYPADKSGLLRCTGNTSETELQRRRAADAAGFERLTACFPNFKKGRPEVTKADIAGSGDVRIFREVFGILRPDVCIVASSKVRDTVGGELKAICSANNCDCFFVPHPGWRQFASSTMLLKKRNLLPEYLKDILAKYKGTGR